MKTTTFASARHLETTLQRYLHLYNQHIPQKNLGHVTPIAKLQEYYRIKPKLFQKKPINHPGPDTYAMCDLYKLSGQQAVQIERLTTLAEVEPNAYGMG